MCNGYTGLGSVKTALCELHLHCVICIVWLKLSCIAWLNDIAPVRVPWWLEVNGLIEFALHCLIEWHGTSECAMMMENMTWHQRVCHAWWCMNAWHQRVCHAWWLHEWHDISECVMMNLASASVPGWIEVGRHYKIRTQAESCLEWAATIKYEEGLSPLLQWNESGPPL